MADSLHAASMNVLSHYAGTTPMGWPQGLRMFRDSIGVPEP